MDEPLARLPRGRHALTAHEVAGDQLRRLATAVVELAAPAGLHPVSIGMIVGRARVSRETFYGHHRDKAACYAAAVQERAAALRERLGQEVPADVDEALGALLTALDEDPQLARCAFLWPPDGDPHRLLEAAVLPALHARLAGAPAFDVAAVARLVEVTVADALAAGEPVGPLREPLAAFAAAHARGRR